MSAEPANRRSAPGFLYALATGYFALGVTSLSVVGLLEPMVADLGVARGKIAFLVTFFALAYGLAAPGMQILVGHLDRRRLILIGLGVMAAGCLIAALAQSYPLIAAARVMMALGASLVGPMVSAAAASLAAPEIRGRALGITFSGLTVATVFGIPFTTLAGEIIGWRLSLCVVGLISLAAAFWVSSSVPAVPEGKRVRVADLLSILRDPVLAPAVLITFFQIAAQFSTYSLIPAVLIQLNEVPRGWIAGALFLYGVGGILGNVVATALVDRMGFDRMIMISLSGLSLVFLALSLFEFGPLSGIAMLFLWSFFGLMLFAPQQMRLVTLGPQQQNLLLALNSSVIYLGMAVGAGIAGLVYEAFGPERLSLISLSISLLAIGAFLMSKAARSRMERAAMAG